MKNNEIVITVKIDIKTTLTFWEAIKTRIAGKAYLDMITKQISDRFITQLDSNDISKVYVNGKKEAERMRM